MFQRAVYRVSRTWHFGHVSLEKLNACIFGELEFVGHAFGSDCSAAVDNVTICGHF